MFESKGEIIPPCGVPFSGKPIPATSAFSMAEIIDNSFLSLIPNVHICFSNFPWLTLSKNPLMSISTTKCRCCPCMNLYDWDIACSALRLGRKPLLRLKNLASQIGSRICKIHCCISRSIIVGIPSGLVLPLPFGISTRRTGCGW